MLPRQFLLRKASNPEVKMEEKWSQIQDFKFSKHPKCQFCKNTVILKLQKSEIIDDKLSFTDFKGSLLLSNSQYEVFCQKCFKSKKYHQRLFKANKNLFKKVQEDTFNEIEMKKTEIERLQNEYSYQYWYTQKWIADWNHFFTIQKQQIQQKEKRVIAEITIIENQLQTISQTLQSLNNKFKQFYQLQHNIDDYVLAVEKNAELEDISNISKIQEQSLDVFGDTVTILNEDISEAMNDFTEFELEVSCPEDQFLFHEDELQYRDRTYAINNSLMSSMKNNVKYIQQEIRKSLQAVAREVKEKQQTIEAWKEPEPVNQEVASFSLILNCSTCNRDLFINKLHFKKVETSHFQMGINFYIFNSSYSNSQNTKVYSGTETFEVFCSDCMNNKSYGKRFMELYNDSFLEVKKNKLKINAFEGQNKRINQIQIEANQYYFIEKVKIVAAFVREQREKEEQEEKKKREKEEEEKQKKRKKEEQEKQKKRKKYEQEKQKKRKKEQEQEKQKKRKKDEQEKQKKRKKDEQEKQKKRKKEQEQADHKLIIFKVKQVRLIHRIQQMKFLRQGGKKRVLAQALQNEELMNLIIKQGNLVFKKLNDQKYDKFYRQMMPSDKVLYQQFKEELQYKRKYNITQSQSEQSQSQMSEQDENNYFLYSSGNEEDEEDMNKIT